MGITASTPLGYISATIRLSELAPRTEPVLGRLPNNDNPPTIIMSKLLPFRSLCLSHQWLPYF
ncbi:hypothetical protein RGQ29_023900 [Quercus rubra]|uniref:Uncharacterized protein n=1 Tax=Quercus rubra TaxID=3512 RepID=A0AAN7F5W4_QUERU|nr:hypothetical protein RGQ29_023900 [Quercus rubra]